MIEEPEEKRRLRVIRDPQNGKVVARVDDEARLLQILPYRRRPVYVPLDEILKRDG